MRIVILITLLISFSFSNDLEKEKFINEIGKYYKEENFLNNLYNVKKQLEKIEIKYKEKLEIELNKISNKKYLEQTKTYNIDFSLYTKQ
jgi:hypothetical protein